MILTALPLTAAAQGTCLRDALGTMRCNDGSSYSVDGLGIARDQKGNNLRLGRDGTLPLDLVIPSDPTGSAMGTGTTPQPQLALPTGCSYSPSGTLHC